MSNLIPEDVAAALALLNDSSIEASPGEGEEKRERKAREARNAEHQAMTVLVTHGISLANRLVAALEKPTIAAMGEGVVVGELAKFEPAFDPALVERAVKALEELAERGREPRPAIAVADEPAIVADNEGRN